ncbi:hypothetical protein K1719_004032 [Acacia pycnantha]|nr:hypothetical protein K1719_004032 [Acacia pycnantha]
MRPRRDADRRRFTSSSSSSSSSSSQPPPPQQQRAFRLLRRLILKLCLDMAGQSRKWMVFSSTTSQPPAIWARSSVGPPVSLSCISRSPSSCSSLHSWASSAMASNGFSFAISSPSLILWCFFCVCYLAAASVGSTHYVLFSALGTSCESITCIITHSLIPILRQPALDPLPSDAVHRDSLIFLILNILAIFTGLYLLLFGSSVSDAIIARRYFAGAIFLLVFPLCIPGTVFARDWFRHAIHSRFRMESSGFILVHVDDLELHKELLTHSNSIHSLNNGDSKSLLYENKSTHGSLTAKDSDGCCERMIDKDQLTMLGEEHPASVVVRRLDFWLYFVAYFCGGTIGLVYSNNLGQIAQSLGLSSNISTLVTLYSSFSFFGRLLSSVPDYIRSKFYFARTGWLTIGLIPTPVAFFLLAASDSAVALSIGTALIGLSSGFIFAAAVSVTSELFGPNNVSVNHNILITNIPIGSLLYGFLAAVVYDANAHHSTHPIVSDIEVCMGMQCYFWTFMWWGCISLIGLASSVLLFIRTKHAYDTFENKRISTLPILS